ncbi:MAG: nucleotidyltransferase, partial [Chloroflexi bacterium]|nr:nucleotidyltransferase [Chloroflexota bacterium]
DAHFVAQEEALGQAHAIWMCRDYLDDGEVLVAFGDGIVNAEYAQIPEPDADGVILVQEMEDPRTFGVVVTDEDDVVTDFIEKPDTIEHNRVIAGIYWFKNGRLLHNAIQTIINENRQTKGEYYLVDAYKMMLEQGAVIKAKPTNFWLDAGKPDYMLEANKRLLGWGYGSEDAIDRSYAEDFTALPPVFIHETAVISNSVIGPYASIGPGTVIEDSIVRNSIVDGGTAVSNAILDGALIGENAKITGKGKALFIGDNSIVDLG